MAKKLSSEDLKREKERKAKKRAQAQKDRNDLLGWHQSMRTSEEITPAPGDLEPYYHYFSQLIGNSGASGHDAAKLKEMALERWRRDYLKKRRLEAVDRIFFKKKDVGEIALDVFLRRLLPQIERKQERLRLACETAANSGLFADLSEHFGAPRVSSSLSQERVQITVEEIPRWLGWMKMDSGVMTRETAATAAFHILVYFSYFYSPEYRGSKGYARKKAKGEP